MIPRDKDLEGREAESLNRIPILEFRFNWVELNPCLHRVYRAGLRGRIGGGTRVTPMLSL